MNMKTALKVVGGVVAFGFVVWLLVILMMKSDHVAQQRQFEKACHREGFFLEYKDSSITNCIDGNRRIVRQYVR